MHLATSPYPRSWSAGTVFLLTSSFSSFGTFIPLSFLTLNTPLFPCSTPNVISLYSPTYIFTILTYTSFIMVILDIYWYHVHKTKQVVYKPIVEQNFPAHPAAHLCSTFQIELSSLSHPTLQLVFNFAFSVRWGWSSDYGYKQPNWNRIFRSRAQKSILNVTCNTLILSSFDSSITCWKIGSRNVDHVIEVD
jgi:hypothetical protein